MKDANKNIIEDVLVQDLGDIIPFYEIRNTIEIMSSVEFDKNSIDKELLQESLFKAMGYLNTITLPIDAQAMNAVYRQQVFIAMDNVKRALTV